MPGVLAASVAPKFPTVLIPDALALTIVITSDAAYPDPSLLIVASVITPFEVVISRVNPVPDPDDVVAIAVPFAYPVPGSLNEPRVLTPDALAFTIVIVSEAVNPVPSLLIAAAVTAPEASTDEISTVKFEPDPSLVVAIAVPVAYPVPAVAIDPSVLTPDALAFTIVIVSSTAYPDPAPFIATPVTTPVSYTHLTLPTIRMV